MTINDIRESISNKTNASSDVNQVMLIEGTSIISRVASIVLGYLSVAILTLITLIVTGEICYICFPVIREKVDELIIKVEGKGVARRAVGVTFRDAVEAVRRANTVEVGEKSALLIYLQLKLKSVMFVAFVISLILKGTDIIINAVWGSVDGLAAVINEAIHKG